MPIYEFVCQDCEHEFETLVRNREEAEEVHCPKCQSPRTKRLMSVTGAIITDGGGGSAKPSVETHTCESGTCSHLNLPGYTR